MSDREGRVCLTPFPFFLLLFLFHSPCPTSHPFFSETVKHLHFLSVSIHPEPAPLPITRPDPVLHLDASLSHQPMEIFVDDETKLTLHGLQQYYVKLKDNEKNRKLFDLLDVLEFNQVSVYT